MFASLFFCKVFLRGGFRKAIRVGNIFKALKMKLLIVLVSMAFSVQMMQAQSVSAHILELESYTKWDAVEKEWASVRKDWEAQAKKENTAVISAGLLLSFESHLKWDAVEKTWKKRRDKWVMELERAVTNNQVAALLIELESNIKWTAVDDKWKARREAWIAELK